MLGRSLFYTQMALLLVAAWPPAAGWQLNQPIYVWLLLAGGVGIAAWTLAHNRPSNFQGLPEVRPDARLIQTGPYHWIRHPMYTSLVVGSLALVLAAPMLWWKWAGWVALILVLAVKSQVEERFLLVAFSDYQAYQQHTWRLLPWLW